MPWGDKSVSPCVWTPGTADAANMNNDALIELAAGKIGPEPLPTGAVLTLYAKNYNATTGVWTDVSSKANHATYYSGKPSLSTSPNRVVWTGAADYQLVIPYSATWGLTMELEFTLGFRFRPRSGGNYAVVYVKSNNGQIIFFLLGTYLGRHNGTSEEVTTSITNDNAWHTIVMSGTAADYKMRLYDGNNSEIGNVTIASRACTANVNIGGLIGNSSCNFAGDITNIIGYDRCLSTADRALLIGVLEKDIT